MESNNCLIEFEIGVGFFIEDTLKHIGSDVWYIVAYDQDEAEELFLEYAYAWMNKHRVEGSILEFSHEFIAMRAVDQITWEPTGKEIML